MVCEGGHTLQSKASPLNNHGYIVSNLLVWFYFYLTVTTRTGQLSNT